MHIAQLNIALAKADLDSPLLKEFTDNLDSINAIADASPGFVWRWQDDEDASTIDLFNDPRLIVNMTVWQSLDALRHFMFKTHHAHFIKHRNEWFKKMPQASYALWWGAEGHIPTLEEAKERLLLLRQKGESPLAFSLKSPFVRNGEAQMASADD